MSTIIDNSKDLFKWVISENQNSYILPLYRLLSVTLITWLLFVLLLGTGSVRVTCQSGQSSFPQTTTATITRSTPPIRPQTSTPPTTSLSSASTYRSTAASNPVQTPNATAYPSDGSDVAAFKRYIIGGAVGGSIVLIIMLIILIITVPVLQRRWWV